MLSSAAYTVRYSFVCNRASAHAFLFEMSSLRTYKNLTFVDDSVTCILKILKCRLPFYCVYFRLKVHTELARLSTVAYSIFRRNMRRTRYCPDYRRHLYTLMWRFC